MRIPLIQKFFEARGRRHLRSAMSGYRSLKLSNQLDHIARVKDALKHTRLDLKIDQSSKQILGNDPKRVELSIRQYLLLHFCGLSFNEALLSSLSNSRAKVVFALPLQWRNILVEHGFRVAHRRSRLLWQLNVAIYFLCGGALFAKQLFLSLWYAIQTRSQSYGRYVYFDSLPANAIPQKVVNGNGYDVMTWYWRLCGSKKKFDTFCHNQNSIPSARLVDTTITAMNGPVQPLEDFNSCINFFLWGMLGLTGAFLDSIRGRWANAIFFAEAVKAAGIRFQRSDLLAREYLFHNSNYLYRPFWTYEAAKKGSEIQLYFYSSNCEVLRRPYGDAKYSNDNYEIMSWSGYMVWDDYQAEFIKRSIDSDVKIKVVGPVMFQSNEIEVPKLLKPVVAIFDVQPVRTTFYRRLGIDFDYYTDVCAISFLDDCYAALTPYNATLAFKRKRNIGRLAHPAYKLFVNKLTKRDSFVTIDSETSAIALINASEAVISMPFTSTALIACAQGKPSVYYDPLGYIQKDDKGAHGIPVLQGLEELQNWLRIIFTDKVADS